MLDSLDGTLRNFALIRIEKVYDAWKDFEKMQIMSSI
jgi:hypothetical protein